MSWTRPRGLCYKVGLMPFVSGKSVLCLALIQLLARRKTKNIRQNNVKIDDVRQWRVHIGGFTITVKNTVTLNRVKSYQNSFPLGGRHGILQSFLRFATPS